MRVARLLTFFLSIFSAPGWLAAQERAIAIRAARLIDGTSKSIVKNAVVVVRGGIIQAAGEARKVSVPADAEVIELGDETLLPGLIDTHGHLSYRPGFLGKGLREQIAEPAPQQITRMLRNARSHLLTGVTTYRMTGENDFTDFVVRDAIETGLHPGPRVIPSGIPITSLQGHGPPQYWRSGKNEILKSVQENAARGAKWQKLLMTDVTAEVAQMTLEDTKTAVDEAHRLGMKVTVHTTGRWGSAIRTAVAAGADNLEHARPLTPDIIRLLVEKKVSISITPFVYTYWPLPKDLWDVLDRCHSGSEWQQTLREMFYRYRAEHPEIETQDRTIQTPDAPERAERDYLPSIRSTQSQILEAHKAGIPMSIGQDSLVGTIPIVMEFLVEAGLTPLEAIAAGTSVPARLIGYGDKLGTIEPGKTADIISVRGNPAENIRDMLNLHFVMKEGVRYDELSWH